MPRVMKKDTPAREKEPQIESIQTLTQSRARRTPKPNPKYGNDSLAFTPKTVKEPSEEPVSEEEEPVVVMKTTQLSKSTVKKIVPKNDEKEELPSAPSTEPRSLRNRGTASNESTAISKQPKQSGPVVKKQKLDFDNDSDGDKTKSDKNIETKLKSQPMRVTRSKQVEEPDSPSDKKETKVTPKGKPQKVESPATSKKDGVKTVDDGFVKIVDINAIIKKADPETVEKSEKSKMNAPVTRASPANKPSPGQSKIQPTVKVSPAVKINITAKAQAAAAIKTPSPVIGTRRKAALQARSEETEESPSAKRFKKEEKVEEVEDVVDLVEEDSDMRNAKESETIQKLIKDNEGEKKNPVVVLKKTSPAVIMKSVNNGKITATKASPRILNSSVMAATKQSSTVKLLNSTKSDKLFSIDLTEENPESDGRKATIVTITNKSGLQNSSNLINKTQTHNNLSKSLNNSLKMFRSPPQTSETGRKVQKTVITPPMPVKKVPVVDKKKQETVTTIGNTKRITRFESWFIIDCPKIEIIPQKHNHSFSLLKLGNTLSNVKLPAKWEYRVNMKLRQDNKKENNNNNMDQKKEVELYTGEIFDKSIKEDDRHRYEPSNIMFKRTNKQSMRTVVDRSVFFKDSSYSITIDGKSCRLIGAPEELTSLEEIEVLLEILDTISITNSCVEHVTNENLIL